MGEFVNLEVSNGVGTIRLDRPKLNPINEQVVRELAACIEEAQWSDDVGAVVVWGGERVFAAGADIKNMADADSVTIHPYISGLQNVINQLEGLPKITIAAINGFALGGGCEITLGCDFRICADNAQLGQPEILLGVIPGAGGTQRLTRLVGVARAKELVYTGRFIPAAEALALGLVHEVVPAEKVYDRAVEMAEGFAAGPRMAYMAAKFSIQNGIETDITNGLLIERQAFAALFATEDQKIGMESFVANGPGKAKFVGR